MGRKFIILSDKGRISRIRNFLCGFLQFGDFLLISPPYFVIFSEYEGGGGDGGDGGDGGRISHLPTHPSHAHRKKYTRKGFPSL